VRALAMVMLRSRCRVLWCVLERQRGSPAVMFPICGVFFPTALAFANPSRCYFDAIRRERTLSPRILLLAALILHRGGVHSGRIARDLVVFYFAVGEAVVAGGFAW
jgi:hypothetical protein